MADVDYENQLKKLNSAIDNIANPLSTLVAIKLADEFYTKDQRKSLYTEYNNLLKSDQNALKNLDEAEPTQDKDLEWGDRVKKYGEATAEEHLSPRSKAQAERMLTIKKLNTFRSEHQLITQLIDAKNQLSHLD